MQPVRITGHEGANRQLLYFTSTSLSENDKILFFISDHAGHPNIFFRHLKTGEEKQLTFNCEGTLKSYVYFDGNENRGLGKASISLDPVKGKVYYIQGKDICCVDMMGNDRVLAVIPEEQVTAFTHVSADGSRLCVPTSDARVLEGNTRGHLDYDIDRRVQEENLNSYIRVYDTSSGEEILTERVPKAWVTHVQFCPVDNNLILYNHEYVSVDCGIRRMWLWDGKNHTRVRSEGEGRSRNDWTCHEMWERDGKGIIYHGIYQNGIPYIGKKDLADSSITEIGIRKEYRRYGHFTVGNGDVLVSDGYYQAPYDDDGVNGEYISIQKISWKSRSIEWKPLLKHGSSWTSQDCHPHPIFNHAGNEVYFTSDVEGYRAIYMIDISKRGNNYDE